MTELTKEDMAKSLARRNAHLAEYAALPAITPQLERMHRAYTLRAEDRCGDCAHCRPRQADGRLLCEIYLHETHKPAYWLASWVACGMWEMREDVK